MCVLCVPNQCFPIRLFRVCVCVCNVVVARKVAMETEDDSLGCWRVPIGNVRLVVCKTKKKTKTNLLLFALSY